MKLTILTDNYVDSQKLKAEHGLSIFIEVDNEKILFDCGQSDMLISNAKVLGIDLNQVTKIILSHGHYDHTGGLLQLLKYLNRKVDIYAHTSVFEAKFIKYKDLRGLGHYRSIGIPEKAGTYEKKGAKFLLSSDLVQISDHVYFSGQINEDIGEESEDIFYTRKNNNHIRDPLYDDISIFINLPGLSVIVTGCAHSGIINILNKSKALKLNNKNIAIIGGLHLSKKDSKYIENIVSEFKKYNIKSLIPMHCTGFTAAGKLASSFGNNCVIGSVGKVLEF